MDDYATLSVGPDDKDGNTVVVKADGKLLGSAEWVLDTIRRHKAEVEKNIAVAQLVKAQQALCPT